MDGVVDLAKRAPDVAGLTFLVFPVGEERFSEREMEVMAAWQSADRKTRDEVDDREPPVGVRGTRVRAEVDMAGGERHRAGGVCTSGA